MTTGLTEKDYALWLFNIEGLGNRSISKLLSGGVSCKDIYDMTSAELKTYLKPKQLDALIRSRNVWDFEKERKKLEDKGIRFISRIDPEYPEKLKNIPDPPFAIYVKGKLPDPDRPAVAIIGARMCSDYGKQMARHLGKGLALAKVQVISGMAAGVDGISQKACLQAGGTSFGIVGSGVDICYPEDNRDLYEGLCNLGGVISEYPPGTQPKANFFPMRNRIISALSDVIVVVEARQHSGTQITVDTALEQGKEVLAVPGRLTDRLSDGCNYLISQGAGVVIDVSDVLDRLWSIRSGGKGSDVQQFTPRSAEGPEAADAGWSAEGTDPALAGAAQEPGDHVDPDQEFTNDGLILPIADPVERAILDAVDVIPISAAGILEKIAGSGIDITIQELMTKLFELSNEGKINQSGVYFMKKPHKKKCRNDAAGNDTEEAKVNMQII